MVSEIKDNRLTYENSKDAIIKFEEDYYAD